MHNAFLISASINHPVLLQYTVEKLARRTNRSHLPATHSIDQWMSDETSSVEAFIDGGLTLNVDGESVRLPFVAPFLFTCMELQSGVCKLAWSQSLS